jgi:hypothetical protein
MTAQTDGLSIAGVIGRRRFQSGLTVTIEAVFKTGAPMLYLRRVAGRYHCTKQGHTGQCQRQEQDQVFQEIPHRYLPPFFSGARLSLDQLTALNATWTESVFIGVP